MITKVKSLQAWISRGNKIMYELYDVVELKDGTIATIIEKFTERDFLFEVPDPDEFMRFGTIDDIKRKISN